MGEHNTAPSVNNVKFILINLEEIFSQVIYSLVCHRQLHCVFVDLE